LDLKFSGHAATKKKERLEVKVPHQSVWKHPCVAKKYGSEESRKKFGTSNDMQGSGAGTGRSQAKL